MKKPNFCIKGSKKTGQQFIDETISMAAQVSSIEINCNYPQSDNFDMELNFLKKAKKKFNLSYVIHAPYLNSSLGDFNQELRDDAIAEIFRSIDRAVFLGSNMVTIHPPFDPYGIYFREKEDVELDTYKQIATYAVERDVKIGLENEAQTCFFFPDRACKFELIKKVIETINMKNFGYTLDLGHGNITGIDIEHSIREASSKLFHIHAHDNFGEKEDLHLAPGDGNIHWNNILMALNATRYDQLFEIETSLENFIKGRAYISKVSEK